MRTVEKMQEYLHRRKFLWQLLCDDKSKLIVMKDNKFCCGTCGADLPVHEVVTYNNDDGGSIDSIDIDYEVEPCFSCSPNAMPYGLMKAVEDGEELPF